MKWKANGKWGEGKEEGWKGRREGLRERDRVAHVGREEGDKRERERG